MGAEQLRLIGYQPDFPEYSGSWQSRRSMVSSKLGPPAFRIVAKLVRSSPGNDSGGARSCLGREKRSPTMWEIYIRMRTGPAHPLLGRSYLLAPDIPLRCAAIVLQFVAILTLSLLLVCDIHSPVLALVPRPRILRVW